MNKLLLALFLFPVVALAQINPSYKQFNTNHFETNATPWKIAVATNLMLTNITVQANSFFGGHLFITNVALFHGDLEMHENVTVSSNVFLQGVHLDPLALFLPSVEYQLWYDPFSSTTFSAGKIGKLGWSPSSQGAGGLGITNSFADNHWGTMELFTRNDAANSIEGAFLGEAIAGQPSIPPLNATTGWTNRFIWRITGSTNGFRSYIHLAGQNTYTSVPIGSGIGIMINSTNSNQVQGMCTHASTQTRTNLGAFALNTWITNAVWCATSGVMSFSMNGGPEATITNNIPTSALTPNIVVMTTAVGTGATLEMDEWVLWAKITP